MNTCNCVDQHHPSTTEENKIFMQIGFRCQHITVNTEINKDHEEKVRKILNGSLTSATIKMNFDSLKLRQLQSCSVQSVSSFQHHLHCIVGKTMDSLDLNMKCKQTLKRLFLSLLMTHACGRKAGLKDFLANQDMGLSTFNLIHSTLHIIYTCIKL